MRIIVDTGRCVGAGQCVLTEPALFDQSEDDGTIIVLNEKPGGEPGAACASDAGQAPGGYDGVRLAGLLRAAEREVQRGPVAASYLAGEERTVAVVGEEFGASAVEGAFADAELVGGPAAAGAGGQPAARDVGGLQGLVQAPGGDSEPAAVAVEESTGHLVEVGAHRGVVA
jgi:ferredoxin